MKSVACAIMLTSLVLVACTRQSEQGSAAAAEQAPTSGGIPQAAGADADVPPVVVDKTKVKYSPYPGQDFPNRVYFGDTHVHTSYSADAGMIGNKLGPEEAYRFARGETVISTTGLAARLARPLDFLVVSDHAEGLGVAPLLIEGDPVVLSDPLGKAMSEAIKAGNPQGSYDLWRTARTKGTNTLEGNKQLAGTAWLRITAAAEKYNTPGAFTAFIGYEWTSDPGGSNLHRNVIFRDGKDIADKIVPFSAADSKDPEDLWRWMAGYEKNTGGKLLAISHGGNLSNGLMFDDITLTTKQPLDRDYAQRRMRWEPLYEVTQMKGDAEAHPMFSTDDEFADFETWDRGSFGPEVKTPDMLPKEYARQAWMRGLAYEDKLGVNPFKFGVIGSTDSHTSLASTTEDNFFGKVVALEPTADPIRFEEVISGRPGPPEARMYARETSASGLAGVWARENTRAELWDAMARKEVFATTGTRLKVRVFGGFDFVKEDLDRSDFARRGYKKGVPMGGDLKAAPGGRSPTFLVRALRDADGANLDRIQIIKGWLGEDGKPRERIYDVAVSGGRTIGRDSRCRTPVGNTVDVMQATYSNSIGAPALEAYWKDPQFDSRQRAFYYVRVMEIPTPRWTTIDARVFGVKLPDDVPASIQERAYTSPIWYTP